MNAQPPPQFIDERSEALRFKLRRALLGALFGLIGGTAFVAIALQIDLWSYPQFSLGLDWDFYIPFWLWLGPGLMLVGFATAWWFETWAGLLTGTLLAATILLLSNMPTSAATPFQKLISFVILFLPSAAICLLPVYFLRWLVRRVLIAWGHPWAVLRIAFLCLLPLLVGAAGGVFMRMPPRAAQAVEQMHASLPVEPAAGSALTKLPGLPAYRGQPFELFYAKSTYTTQGYDVRAVYGDGYTVTCAVVVFPPRPAYLTRCTESAP